MNDSHYKNEAFEFHHLNVPDYEWECHINQNFVLNVEKGKAPNAFHRFMQKLILGFRWVRKNEKQ